MIKTRSPHDQLLSLQKKIYRSLSEQARRLLGVQPEAIRSYEREFQRDFKKLPKTFSVLTRENLIDEIRAAKVTLIGDFHTFAQAQRTALRILRGIKGESKFGDHKWHLALEIFPTHRQNILDEFQNGEISEERFLETIRFDEWGFPWEHYAPLIRWSISNGVKLVALNLPDEMGTDLHSRDQWAAGILTDLFLKNRKSRAVVLYGELHLGQSHLPSQLAKTSKSALGKPLKTIVVHQNQEKIFWKMARDSKDSSAEILKLGRRRFCVLSSTPWNKLQSVVNWAEGAFPTRADSTIDLQDEEIDFHDSHDDTHSSIRLLTLMRDFSLIQGKFLDLPAPSFESLNLYTIENADFFNKTKLSLLNPTDRTLLKFHILYNERVYLPDSEIVYLATPSENAAAEIAALHLLNSHLKTLKPAEEFYEGNASDFYRWVLSFAFGFLGSLILNPRRKCDLVEDHAERLKQLGRGEKPTFPGEIEARKLAYIWLTAEHSEDSSALEALTELTSERRSSRKPVSISLFWGARYLGQALAKSVHRTLLYQDQKPLMSVADLRRCFVGEDTLPPPFWRYSALRKLSLLEHHGGSKDDTL